MVMGFWSSSDEKNSVSWFAKSWRHLAPGQSVQTSEKEASLKMSWRHKELLQPAQYACSFFLTIMGSMKLVFWASLLQAITGEGHSYLAGAWWVMLQSSSEFWSDSCKKQLNSDHECPCFLYNFRLVLEIL